MVTAAVLKCLYHPPTCCAWGMHRYSLANFKLDQPTSAEKRGWGREYLIGMEYLMGKVPCWSAQGTCECRVHERQVYECSVFEESTKLKVVATFDIPFF